MSELVHQLETVAKAADVVFGDLQTKWFQAGQGSEGAKHALGSFRAEYESLIAQGKNTEANDLLAGTLKSAQHILDTQKQAQSTFWVPGMGQHPQQKDRDTFTEASNELKKQGISYTEKEIQAQQTLVDALKAQAGAQERITQLKKLEQSNATHETGNKESDERMRQMMAQVKAEEREAQESARLWEENRRVAIANIEEQEKEKIAATEKGSAERIAAIDAAIKRENAYGLQETSFYRGLLTSRVEILRQMTDEESKLKAEAAKESAEHTLKMGELELAAEKQRTQLQRSLRHASVQEIMSDEIASENAEYQLKMAAFDREIAALEKHGKDYENKLKAIQDKEEELTQTHENKLTQITNKADEDRNSKTISAIQHLEDEIARGLTNVLMRHESFGKMMASIGDQVLSGMMETAIKSLMALDMTKEREAASAARQAFLAGMHFPFPINIAAAPVMAAGAFAAVMAFEGGGIVPGVEHFDAVPARLTPGEAVIPKQMTERLNRAADDGDEPRGAVHVHVHNAHTIHAIDATGVDRMLQKHAGSFQRHVENTIRRMNK